MQNKTKLFSKELEKWSAPEAQGNKKKFQCPSLVTDITIILFFIVHKTVGRYDETIFQNEIIKVSKFAF